MSGTKSSRSAAVKRDGSLRYATRHTAVEKGKRSNQHKETNRTKPCDCLQKADNGKSAKQNNSKLALKKSTSNKSLTSKNAKSKTSSANHREKVVIVSKRSSSVSVVKSCKLRKSVSVKKVSYSTSVVLSSDEDTDSDEESEDEKEEEEQTQKTKTVLKRTTSKVKSTEKKSERKTQTKTSQKAKAIKLLCEKLSDKHKDPNRELRPRFPYSMLQEIPTARSHRMASLNALAKVHVLYENEGRSVGENLNDADESSLIDFLNENSDEEEEKKSSNKSIVKKERKQSTSVNEKKSTSKKVIEEKTKKEKTIKKNKSRVVEPKTVQKRKRKKKMPEVEIIDTRICKRMASLNAQAILAASYLHEPKRKRNSKSDYDSDSSETDDDDEDDEDDDKEVFLESKCDLKIIESEDKEKTIKIKEPQTNTNKQKNEKNPVKENSDKNVKSTYETPISEMRSNWSVESDVAVSETRTSRTTPLSVSSTSTKVGVTQYTEVTKVHINTCQESEIKEETKSERNIEHILSNDDVAITQMYHYQSKNSNESYCVQMQTTYKPGSKSITPPSVALSPNNPIHKHLSETVLPSGQNFYGGPSHSSLIPPQPYHITPNLGPMPPVIGMEHRVPRQYGGSAFTVPHYRQSSQGQYPRNEYGYYQPAGPLIQPTSDQLTIHKPVPYHPQPNLHQSPQPPSSNRNAYQNFPSHHSNSSLSSRQPQVPHRQKHIVSACPPPLEILPPQPKHPRYPRSRPNEGISSRGYSSQSFDESPKRIPSMHSYSTQNTPSYPKNKGETNVYERYSRPYEQKDQYSRNSFSSSQTAYNAPHQNVTQKSSHLPSQESVRPHDSRLGQSVSRSDIHQHPPSRSENSSYKNMNEMVHSKEKSWGIRDNQTSISSASSNLTPYQQESRKIPPIEVSESTVYPIRPPSVIEIIDEIPRDTKTYIQLEVPKNSHREKIVVVDVENDEIEQKENVHDKAEIISPPITPIIKPAQEDNKEVIIKIEEKAQEPTNDEQKSDIIVIEDKSSEGNSRSEVTIIEVKKKKESAVVRRARLHGKQRTFRDCYNRPLAQLSKSKKSEEVSISEDHTDKKFQPLVSLPRLVLPKAADKKPVHGWSWEGPAQDKLVYVSNDSPPCLRKCYPTIRHAEGDVISVRDSVFLRSGPRKTDLPFVARVTALWEEPTNGEMNMSLLWYYRPEHTDTGKKISYAEDEIFASKHRDTNSVACIEDKCYVLTYAEYCRYKKRCKFMNDATSMELSIVPEGDESCKIRNLPPINISPDLVLFSRKVYDYRQKRLLKNPV